jgi:hypothetical protein
VVAVIRYALSVGTVYLRLQLTYFMLLLTYHRRAGKETYNIPIEAFVYGWYEDHETVVVRNVVSSKTRNFSPTGAFLDKEDVLVGCPLAISLVRWLISHTEGLPGHPKHGSVLWHKPRSLTQKVAGAGAASLFKDECYSTSTCEDWCRSLLEQTRAHHSTHSLGNEIPFEQVWSGNDELDLSSGTGMRRLAENMCQRHKVLHADACAAFGRATGSSRDSYLELQMADKFAVAMVVCP